MTLQQVVRTQTGRTPEPPVEHVVVWSGAMERKGETFSLVGHGWHTSQLAYAGDVEQGRQARKGAGVTR